MMLFHHCFSFPEYWLDLPQIPSVLIKLGSFNKICVAIFAFLSGYGFYVNGDFNYRTTIKKALKFMAKYWFQLFVVFLPIACIGYQFSPIKILYNAFALFDNIIVFAWYVLFYLIVLLTFPFFKRLLKGKWWTDLLTVIGGGYLLVIVLYFSPRENSVILSALMDCAIYYPVVGVGYLFAKYDIFAIITKYIKHTVPAAVVVFAVVFLLRSKVSVIKGFTLDAVYAPMIILAFWWLLRALENAHVNRVLSWIGKMSFSAWLFHSIFFSAYTSQVVQPFVNWSPYILIRFLLVTIISLLASFIIEQIYCLAAMVLKKEK